MNFATEAAPSISPLSPVQSRCPVGLVFVARLALHLADDLEAGHCSCWKCGVSSACSHGPECFAAIHPALPSFGGRASGVRALGEHAAASGNLWDRDLLARSAPIAHHPSCARDLSVVSLLAALLLKPASRESCSVIALKWATALSSLNVQGNILLTSPLKAHCYQVAEEIFVMISHEKSKPRGTFGSSIGLMQCLREGDQRRMRLAPAPGAMHPIDGGPVPFTKATRGGWSKCFF
ncbi:hypothetical protein L1887_50659 [Cichorium endivia]|nr:hypothetical protein L1887_50659 [Cichorium endivia]